jgi:hypothetical protein
VLISQSKDIQSTIDEMILISKIKPILSSELKVHPDEIDLVLDAISTQLSEPKQRIKDILDKYTVSRIFKVKTDIDKHKQDKDVVDNNLKNLDTYVWNEKYLK